MSPENIYTRPHNLFATPDISPDANKDEWRQPGDVQILLYPYYSKFDAHELIKIARALVNPRGKGIYATDEAPYAMDDLLASLDEDPKLNKTRSEEDKRERRKKWRVCMYSAAPTDYISGVILHDETLRDFKLAEILSEKGIIPGVRANLELTPIPRSEDEFIVQGLDDLLSKMQAARAEGARFSKWRAPIACSSVEGGFPSRISLETQAETLAQFAAISQQAGLVPIVEPDVDFSRDADLTRSAEIHEQAIAMIYERMRAHGVLLEGSLIKPSFPQPGLRHPSRSNVTPEEIAVATATVLSRAVPAAVPGILFLSGGLPSSQATQWLAAINALVLASPPTSPFTRLPPLTFSYGRALQGEPMKHWVKGDEEAAKAALVKWSKACWHAARGEVL
ncbi:Fructose-bisphosphate aldolase 5, cytosolic [Psilocybe cubensis]|uniref:Fructose-bisphosphate aldolase 5, cytosolic n=1 Tax=Psilocybe cubensis TaxID=181762 RepID=A0ACB8GY65_PSICU|nr:Fructose-bisphosphate aldolase 5, cytosolic [Psilocybe cubensis]KAH9480534.1 Fructose-bisphosphate aldolase 5, cytosolic [Psilocybe cubensis]